MSEFDVLNGSAHWTNVTVIKEGAVVDETTASLEGYFFIKPCQLIGKIIGGNGKAVGFEGIFS